MLSYLAVKNFAILENIEVTFNEGMTVLTGETGAGKSLLIDAIGLLLGDRASSEVVRSGENSCVVTGIFSPLSETLSLVLADLEVEALDNELIIKRQINANSSNVIKLNNQVVTLQQLREVTKTLADIHTQHDTKRLINPETYLELLDLYDETLKTKKSQYQTDYTFYKTIQKKLNTLKKEKNETLERMDLLRFQAEEIEKHQLEVNEEEAIEQRLLTLKNFDKIYQAIKESYQQLDGDTLNSIYQTTKELEKVENYEEAYQDYKARTESAYFELDDIRSSLYDTMQSLDFDPDELDQLETRKHTLDTLKRKYHRDINDIIAYYGDITQELSGFDHYDETLNKVETDYEEALKTLKASANELTNARKNVAKRIEKTLLIYLKDLELKDADFKVVFQVHESFTEEGQDDIDFHLTTNKGEQLKPLNKVASGGELSRIMLALKEILVANGQISLMIFDEIDTGVSGYVASQVALKMKKIATMTQVVTISHLPQVAAKADHHYYIYKESDDSRTRAFIKSLDYDGRIKAIAEMISGDLVTDSALISAKELLK